MAFVLSSVLPMYFTTPVQFKGHPAQARLKNLRSACDWASYAQEAAQHRSMGTDVSLFQWCLPGAGGGTVFSFASMEIEALVAHYNVLAGVCVDLVDRLRDGEWVQVGELSPIAAVALQGFDEAANELFTVEGRDASCRPHVSGTESVATAGMLPCVFSRAWVDVVATSLSEVRQCVACHNATVQHASDETLVALEKGALVTMARLCHALVTISLMPRSGDVAWTAVARQRTVARAELVARELDLARWGVAVECVEPIIIPNCVDDLAPLERVVVVASH